MLYRFAGAVRRAAREETFAAAVGAAIALELTGTVVYTLGEAGISSTGSTSPSAR
jgi:hypothetical protein